MDTNRYKHRRRQYALTAQQRTAVDLILSGSNDRQVAEQLGIGRVTVTRWRNYDPQFQLALNNRRVELWAGATDAMRVLLPSALDTIREQLRISPMRGRLALDLVVRAGILGKPYSGAIATADVGPLTLDDLLDQEVLRHRAATGLPSGGDGDDASSPTPITEQERDAAYDRLMAQLNAPIPDSDAEPEAAPPPAPASISTPTPAPPPPPDPHAPITTKRMGAFS